MANPFAAGEVRTLAVGDLQADGHLEVVVGRASPGETKQLNVFESNGSVRAGGPRGAMARRASGGSDLNGDGFTEIIGPQTLNTSPGWTGTAINCR